MSAKKNIGPMMTKALLRHFHGEQYDALLPYFPSKLAAALEEGPLPSNTPLATVLNPKKWLHDVHYSWFLAPFNELPAPLRSFYLASLLPEQARKLAPLLKLNPPTDETNSFIRPWLTQRLKQQMLGNAILPQELLPRSEMNALLALSKGSLVHLIDLLGMYDLSVQIRQVVDKSVIEKTKRALTKEQLDFLSFASRQPMKWIPPQLDLKRIINDPKKLHLMLHKRGLVRLAKGLFGEDPSLIWHVERKLDLGRGKALIRIMEEKHDLNLTPFFKEQILHLSGEMQR